MEGLVLPKQMLLSSHALCLAHSVSWCTTWNLWSKLWYYRNWEESKVKVKVVRKDFMEKVRLWLIFEGQVTFGLGEIHNIVPRNLVQRQNQFFFFFKHRYFFLAHFKVGRRLQLTRWFCILGGKWYFFNCLAQKRILPGQLKNKPFKIRFWILKAMETLTVTNSAQSTFSQTECPRSVMGSVLKPVSWAYLC